MKTARVLAASCAGTVTSAMTPEARLTANRRMIGEVLDRAARFRPDFVCMPEEAIFSLVSELPDRTVDELEQKFGLTSLRRYLDDAAAYRDTALARR